MTKSNKYLIILVLILATGIQPLFGQSFYKQSRNNKPSLSIAASSMRSIRGWKHGVDLSINSQKNWSIGVFSYTRLASSETGSKSFQGIQVGFPFISNEKWSVGTNQKLGLYDKQFVSLIPTLKLDFKMNENLTASMGGGVSDRYPVFDFKLVFSLKNLL